jgi:serine/threonine-protein kinase
MNCSSCATELDPQATICSACGRLVEDPLVGTIVNDRYKIQAKLAFGGFGSIYRATQASNNRRVAIKVMHPELSKDRNLVARFRREAVALCSLRDEHTVTTYELDQMPDGRLFIVMELLEGRNLLEQFRSSGPLPWRRVLGIARAVCGSLAEAHARGIVHRDLKPANIFLEQRGGNDFVKVLDFGIAKIRQGSDLEEDEEAELTVAGQAIGTLEYMAPEQLMGGKCDGRTDLYSLGVVIYEMIVGRRPFAAAGVVELLTAQVAQKAPKPGLFVPLPGAVSEIVLRCLERDESARYPDADALAVAIDEVLRQSDVELLATRTSTTRGHLPARKVTTGPVAHLGPPAPRPSIAATPPQGLEHAPPAPWPGDAPTQPTLMPGLHVPAAADQSGVVLAPLPREPTGPARPRPRPRPRTSTLRIALFMVMLAAIGVGAGMLISELGI